MPGRRNSSHLTHAQLTSLVLWLNEHKAELTERPQLVPALQDRLRKELGISKLSEHVVKRFCRRLEIPLLDGRTGRVCTGGFRTPSVTVEQAALIKGALLYLANATGVVFPDTLLQNPAWQRLGSAASPQPTSASS